MSHGKAAARDLRYGRRGGGWADEFERPTTEDAQPCRVCGEALTLGQRAKTHYVCAPTCQGCWRPANNCQCRAEGAPEELPDEIEEAAAQDDLWAVER